MLDSRLRYAHSQFAEASRASAMACPHYLHGLTFATVWCAPVSVLTVVAYGIAGVPEHWCDAAIAWVLQDFAAFAILDFPGNFSRKLEVVAHAVY